MTNKRRYLPIQDVNGRMSRIYEDEMQDKIAGYKNTEGTRVRVVNPQTNKEGWLNINQYDDFVKEGNQLAWYDEDIPASVSDTTEKVSALDSVPTQKVDSVPMPSANPQRSGNTFTPLLEKTEPKQTPQFDGSTFSNQLGIYDNNEADVPLSPLKEKEEREESVKDYADKVEKHMGGMVTAEEAPIFTSGLSEKQDVDLGFDFSNVTPEDIFRTSDAQFERINKRPPTMRESIDAYENNVKQIGQYYQRKASEEAKDVSNEIKSLEEEIALYDKSLSIDGFLMPEQQTKLNKSKLRLEKLKEEKDKINEKYLGSPLYKDYLKKEENIAKSDANRYRRELASESAKSTTVRTPFAPAYIAYEDPEKVRNLNSAVEMAEQRARIYGAPSRYDEKTGKIFTDFASAVGDVMSSQDFWTLGFTEIARNFDIRGIQEKLATANKALLEAEKRGIEDVELKDFGVSDEDMAALTEFFKLSDAVAARQEDTSKSYRAGQGFAENIPFMVEFAITGGITSGISKGVSVGLKKALTNAFKKSLGLVDDKIVSVTGKKVAANVLNNATEAIGKSIAGIPATLISPSTYNNLSQKLTEVDMSGNLVYQNGWDAVVPALADSYIERLSEAGIENIASGSVGIAAKSLFKRLPKTKISNMIDFLSGSTFGKIAKATGFHGMLGEIEEEFFGNGLRLMTGLMDKEEFKDFASWDNMLVMAGSFLPMTLMGAASNGASLLNANSKRKSYRNDAISILENAGVKREDAKKFFSDTDIDNEDISSIAKRLKGLLKDSNAFLDSESGQKLVADITNYLKYDVVFNMTDSDKRKLILDSEAPLVRWKNSRGVNPDIEVVDFATERKNIDFHFDDVMPERDRESLSETIFKVAENGGSWGGDTSGYRLQKNDNGSYTLEYKYLDNNGEEQTKNYNFTIKPSREAEVERTIKSISGSRPKSKAPVLQRTNTPQQAPASESTPTLQQAPAPTPTPAPTPAQQDAAVGNVTAEDVAKRNGDANVDDNGNLTLISGRVNVDGRDIDFTEAVVVNETSGTYSVKLDSGDIVTVPKNSISPDAIKVVNKQEYEAKIADVESQAAEQAQQDVEVITGGEQQPQQQPQQVRVDYSNEEFASDEARAVIDDISSRVYDENGDMLEEEYAKLSPEEKYLLERDIYDTKEEADNAIAEKIAEAQKKLQNARKGGAKNKKKVLEAQRELKEYQDMANAAGIAIQEDVKVITPEQPQSGDGKKKATKGTAQTAQTQQEEGEEGEEGDVGSDVKGVEGVEGVEDTEEIEDTEDAEEIVEEIDIDADDNAAINTLKNKNAGLGSRVLALAKIARTFGFGSQDKEKLSVKPTKSDVDKDKAGKAYNRVWRKLSRNRILDKQDLNYVITKLQKIDELAQLAKNAENQEVAQAMLNAERAELQEYLSLMNEEVSGVDIDAKIDASKKFRNIMKAFISERKILGNKTVVAAEGAVATPKEADADDVRTGDIKTHIKKLPTISILSRMKAIYNKISIFEKYNDMEQEEKRLYDIAKLINAAYVDMIPPKDFAKSEDIQGQLDNAYATYMRYINIANGLTPVEVENDTKWYDANGEEVNLEEFYSVNNSSNLKVLPKEKPELSKENPYASYSNFYSSVKEQSLEYEGYSLDEYYKRQKAEDKEKDSDTAKTMTSREAGALGRLFNAYMNELTNRVQFENLTKEQQAAYNERAKEIEELEEERAKLKEEGKDVKEIGKKIAAKKREQVVSRNDIKTISSKWFQDALNKRLPSEQEMQNIIDALKLDKDGRVQRDEKGNILFKDGFGLVDEGKNQQKRKNKEQGFGAVSNESVRFVVGRYDDFRELINLRDVNNKAKELTPEQVANSGGNYVRLGQSNIPDYAKEDIKEYRFPTPVEFSVPGVNILESAEQYANRVTKDIEEKIERNQRLKDRVSRDNVSEEIKASTYQAIDANIAELEEYKKAISDWYDAINHIEGGQENLITIFQKRKEKPKGKLSAEALRGRVKSLIDAGIEVSDIVNVLTPQITNRNEFDLLMKALDVKKDIADEMWEDHIADTATSKNSNKKPKSKREKKQGKLDDVTVDGKTAVEQVRLVFTKKDIEDTPLKINGAYNSLEAAVQAQKLAYLADENVDKEEILKRLKSTKDDSEAKKIGKGLKVNKEWEEDEAKIREWLEKYKEQQKNDDNDNDDGGDDGGETPPPTSPTKGRGTSKSKGGSTAKSASKQKQTTTPKTSTKKKTMVDEALAIAQEEAEGKDFAQWVKDSEEEDSGKKKALGAIAKLMKSAGLNTRVISSKQIKENLGRNTESENIELSNRIPRNRKIDADVEAELQEIKENSNFDTNYNTLTINRDEYTDDFRRVQEESRNLSKEDVSRYHRGANSRDYDDARRSLGAVYGGLLSRNLTSSVGSRSLTSEKNGITFNILQVNGSLFHDIFEINRNYLQNGELVDLHDNYDNCKCYLSDDGLCGFAIENDGNLISVFSMSPNKKGFLYAIKDFVQEQGATHLDAYSSNKQPLDVIYRKALGFVVASSMDYNMEYDHDDISINHGKPKIVFMVANKNAIHKHFNKNEYDAAKEHQVKSVTNNVGTFSEENDDKLIGTTKRWDESGQPMTELRNNNGVVLGYINHSTKTVYINEEEFDMATPIHEYTHAWARMMQEVDSKEWNEIVNVLKKEKGLWEETKQLLGENATDDAIASEMLSELSGVKGKEYFEAAKGKNEKEIISDVKSQIKKVLGDFWNWVASNIFGVHMNNHKYDLNTVVHLPLRSFVNGVELSKQRQVYSDRLKEAEDNLLKTLVENGIEEGKTVKEKISLYVDKWAEKNKAIIDATVEDIAKKRQISNDKVEQERVKVIQEIKDTILKRMNIVSKMSSSSAGRSKGNIDSGFRKQVNSYLLGNGDVSRKGETNSYYEVNNRGDIKTVAQAANAALSDMVNGHIEPYDKPVDSKKKTGKLTKIEQDIIEWVSSRTIRKKNGNEYNFTKQHLEDAFNYINSIKNDTMYRYAVLNNPNKASTELKAFVDSKGIDELFRWYDTLKIYGAINKEQEETLDAITKYITENKLQRPIASNVASYIYSPQSFVIKQYIEALVEEKQAKDKDADVEKIRKDISDKVNGAIQPAISNKKSGRLYSLSTGETKIPQKQARIITKQLLKKLPNVRGSVNRVEFYDATMPVDMISNMTAIQYGDYALGFVDKRTETVYLNTRSMNVDTPFHEIGIHRLMAAAKTLGNEEFTNAILSFGRKAVEAAKYDTAMATMLNKFKSAYDFLDEGSEFYEEFAANVLGHMNNAKLQKFIKDNSNVVKRAYNTISSFISDIFGKQYAHRSPLSSINQLGLKEMSDAIYDAIMDGKVLERNVQSPEENRVEYEKKQSVIEQLDEGVKTPAEWISEIKDKVSEYNKKNKNNKVDFGEVITWLSSFSPLAKINKYDISRQVNDRYYDSLPNIRNANRVLSKFGLAVTPIVRYLISAESVVESLERLIKKNGGEIGSTMEYSKTNTLVGSKVSAKVDEFRDTLMEKLNDICNKIIDNSRASKNPVSQENIEDYKRAKHAIERNRYIVSKQVLSGLKEGKSIPEMKVQQLYDAFKGGKSVSEVAGVYNIDEKLVKAIFTKFDDINNSKEGDNRSGYTTSEAIKIVTEFENIVGEKDVKALNDKFREASNAVIKELEDTGLISATMAEDFRGRYNFYVPLRGWDLSEDRVAFFQDFDYRPSTTGNQAQAMKAAKGRQTRSASPFSSLEYIAMDAIAKGESNKSRQSIYRMALKNQDKASDLIYVQSDANSIAEELGLLNSDGQVTVATTPKWVYDLYDKDREVRGRKGEGVVGSENESKHNRIEVYVDGKKYNIYVSGELGKQVAKAVNGTKNLSSMIASINDNATRKTLKFAWDGMRNSTRFFSNLQTTYRFLSFFLPNFHRDALIPTQTFIEHGFKRAAKVWLGYIPSIIQVFKGDILNNPSEEYKEASRNGYAISYAKRESETDVLDRYNRRTRRLKKGKREESKANIANNKFVDIMSILEKAVRYSAYQAAKKDGASDDEAAYAAHTVSGNFSEKGTQTALSGVLSFYNPTVQSLLQQFRNWRDHSGRTAAAYMAHFTLGLISNIALRAMVDDDDDEKKGLDSGVFGKDNPYNEMSENTKQTRLVIPTNVKDTYTDNAYGEVEGFTIHLPHNYRVLWYLSAKICDVASGADDIDTAAKDVANALLKEVNPVANLTYHSEDVPPIFVPSFLRPIIEAYSNTNYYGGNISRSDEARLDEYGNIVKGELPKGGTNEVLKRAGNELQFDAEKWEHILKSYLGDIWNIFDYATDVTMKSDAEQERYTTSPFEKAIRTIYPENEALYSRVEELKEVAQIGADIQSRTKDYTDLERFGKYDEKTKNKITSQYDERFPIAAKELYDEYKQEITKLESIFALAVKDEKGDFGDKKYESEKASNALKGIRRLNAEYGKAFQDLKEEHKKGKKQK